MIAPGRRASQQGSALLVVLVFAAVIAIMLYRELPVATFEAQRQKEELLIDRGNEYKRAVQLYVRKLQSFPPSLDALENTNRMRFLRARYPDPFTGKADWRLLHAGPGGMITDSKVKKAASGLTGAAGSQGSTLGAGSSVTNPFANSFNGADPSGQQSGPANNFPQRPPAVSAGGGLNQPQNTDMFGQNGVPPIDPQTGLAIQNSLQNGANPSQAGGTAPYPGYPGPADASGQRWQCERHDALRRTGPLSWGQSSRQFLSARTIRSNGFASSFARPDGGCLGNLKSAGCS